MRTRFLALVALLLASAAPGAAQLSCPGDPPLRAEKGPLRTRGFELTTEEFDAWLLQVRTVCEWGATANPFPVYLTAAEGNAAYSGVGPCDSGEAVIALNAGAAPTCGPVSGGGSVNSFETITPTSGTAPVADSPTDTLTLTAGAGVTITGNAATDTITIASTAHGHSSLASPDATDTFTLDNNLGLWEMVGTGWERSYAQLGAAVENRGWTFYSRSDPDRNTARASGADGVLTLFTEDHSSANQSFFTLDNGTITGSALSYSFVAGAHALDLNNAGVFTYDGTAIALVGQAPTAHATSHKHGGADEVATATPAANAIPKAGGGGTLAAGWVSQLAANGTNCSAGNYPLGVDASGNAEDCTAAGGGGGAGDVIGPSSATDNAVARFDATTGKLIQNSAATLDDSGNLTLPEQGALLTGVITPSALTADQDDWNPTGGSTASVWLVSSNATRNLYGIATGVAGRVLHLVNVGSNTILLHPQFGTSAAANRFAFRAGGYSGAVSLAGGTGLTLIYDGAASRWRSLDFVLSDVILPAGQFGGAPWRISGVGGMVIVDTIAGGVGTLGAGIFSLGNVTTADTTLERQAATVAKLKDALRLNPRSSPPVTCGAADSEGVIYSDSDGSKSLCWCTGSAWVVVAGAGACS